MESNKIESKKTSVIENTTYSTFLYIYKKDECLSKNNIENSTLFFIKDTYNNILTTIQKIFLSLSNHNLNYDWENKDLYCFFKINGMYSKKWCIEGMLYKKSYDITHDDYINLFKDLFDYLMRNYDFIQIECIVKKDNTNERVILYENDKRKLLG